METQKIHASTSQNKLVHYPKRRRSLTPWPPGSNPDVLRARVRGRVYALVLGAPQEPALCLHLDQGQSKPGVSEHRWCGVP